MKLKSGLYTADCGACRLGRFPTLGRIDWDGMGHQWSRHTHAQRAGPFIWHGGNSRSANPDSILGTLWRLTTLSNVKCRVSSFHMLPL